MRIAALLLLTIGSVALSALLATRAADHLSSATRAPVRVAPEPAPRTHHSREVVPGFRRTPHSPATAREKPSARRAELGPRIGGISLALLIALEVAGGTLGLGVSAVGLAARRARHRRLRPYGLYRLHLSPHDEAKPQDLEDMVEAIAGLVRAFPADRARRGQPFVAVELRHQLGPSGALEWSISLRCEPAIAVALDGALSAAYPDVRLGHTHGESPQPEPEHLAVPGHVMRFRKARGFVYPLLAAGDDLASPPLEAVAHAQVSLDVPSVIRIALTPAPLCFEALARRLYRAHENRLVRQEHWGLPEGGLHSTLNRAEMTNAQRTQNRSLFWLEAVVAAADRETCRQLGATLQARRGENRLHRRWMPLRTDLYRRRFPAATPPLIPSPRALVSAAEVAHLLALPSARMKGVQVRRLAIPRLPMPPDVLRARPTETVEAPTRSARLATAGTEQTP